MKPLSILLMLALLTSTVSYSQNYNKQFKKSIQKSLGKDYKNYQFLSYPIDNFGVLTCYDNAPKDENIAAETASFIGAPPKNREEWLNLKGFIFTPGQGGTIKLDSKSQTDVAVSTILPKVFEALKLSASFNKKSVKHVEVFINRGYKRLYNPDKFQKFIVDSMSGKANYAYKNKTLVYVCGDFVIDSMSVKVTLDNDLSAKVDGELSMLPEGITSNPSDSTQSSSTKVSVGIKHTGGGSYEITFNKPVIVARLIKYQPQEGPLDAETGDFTTKAADPSLIK